MSTFQKEGTGAQEGRLRGDVDAGHSRSIQRPAGAPHRVPVTAPSAKSPAVGVGAGE